MNMFKVKAYICLRCSELDANIMECLAMNDIYGVHGWLTEEVKYWKKAQDEFDKIYTGVEVASYIRSLIEKESERVKKVLEIAHQMIAQENDHALINFYAHAIVKESARGDFLKECIN